MLRVACRLQSNMLEIYIRENCIIFLPLRSFCPLIRQVCVLLACASQRDRLVASLDIVNITRVVNFDCTVANILLVGSSACRLRSFDRKNQAEREKIPEGKKESEVSYSKKENRKPQEKRTHGRSMSIIVYR